MVIVDDIIRCDECMEIIPDLMLWLQMVGTYKADKKYVNVRLDFCDMYCANAYISKIHSSTDKAKHKLKKEKK